jgi:hypothetical protein
MLSPAEQKRIMSGRITKCERQAIKHYNALKKELTAEDKTVETEREVEHPEEEILGLGVYGDWHEVGFGEVTKSTCGKWVKSRVCFHTDLHPRFNLVTGERLPESVYFEKVRMSCDSMECPICKDEWAKRNGVEWEYKIQYIAQKYKLQPEHLILSFSESEYTKLMNGAYAKRRIVKVLKAAGVVGGIWMAHATRTIDYAKHKRTGKPMGRYFSFHVHIVGFLKVRYQKCRECTKLTDGRACLACEGFEGVVRRLNLKMGGIILKVAEERSPDKWLSVPAEKLGTGMDLNHRKTARKTVGGTIFYQATHACFLKGKKRNTCIHSFGIMAHRNEKIPKKPIEPRLCPFDGYELEEGVYVGSMESAPPFYELKGLNPYRDENGCLRWIPKHDGC